MIRLLGVITGSALAAGTLLLFVGIPEFKSETVQAERTPVRLPRPTQPVDEAAPVAHPETQTATLGTETAPRADEAPAAMPAASDESGSDAAAANQAPDRAPAVERPAADGWYVFWSPFRSRIAAEGFVARLQSVTGLDYRIVRREPGAWEVSFSYADDGDIDRHLSQISAATGLELAETP